MSLEQLFHAAKNRAFTPKTQDQARHAVGDKLRKWKKPRDATKAVASGLTAVIPIPGVGLAVDTVIDKAISKVTGKSRARKAENAVGLQSQVKHQIKQLNVNDLDRARLKAKEELEAFNKLLAMTGTDEDLCELSFNLAYRFYRAQARTEILRTQAEVLKQVSEDILQWCDQLDTTLDAKEQTMENMLKQMYNRHQNCGSKCLHTPAGKTALISQTGYEVA